MTGLRSVHPRVGSALAFASLFVLLGVFGRGLRGDRERLSRILAQEREVRALMEQVEGERLWLEGQLTRGLDAPQVLLDTYAPGSRISAGEPEETVLTGTYRLRRVILTVEGVPWEKVHAVIEAFEGRNPPWRLQKFAVESGLTGLEGRLHFEGMEPAP